MKKYALFTVLFVLSLFDNATANSAIESLRQAAERGEVEAQFQLGIAYYTGMNVIQDYRAAVKWYQKAAEQGLVSAQHNLGVAYSKGLGVPQDDRKAIQWYRKAAEQGDWRAQNNLGNLYSLGKGVTQNFQKAAYWYRKAAEQGYAIAQNNLGIAYQNGQGVPQDIQKAMGWYRKAAEQGYTEAQYNLTKFPLSAAVPVTQSRPIAPSKKIPVQAQRVDLSEGKKETVQRKETPVHTSVIRKSSSAEKKPSLSKDSKKQEIAASHSSEIQETQKSVDLSRYTLALHYTDPQDADFIKRLSTFLKGKGYAVDRISRMNIQLYRPQWDIRYYDDASAATVLKQHIEAFVDHTQATESSPIQIKNFSFLSKTRKIRKGRLEVWLLNPTIKRL
jgi:TPR repeat protein